MVGMNSSEVALAADVNDDQEIGLEEVVGIALQPIHVIVYTGVDCRFRGGTGTSFR